MDIAYQASYVVTGHDKLLQLWSMNTGDKIWEKKPDSVRKTGSMDQLKVFVDDLASVIIASSTDKYVSIYEGATGQLISRFTCGEITTAMCMSSNFRHLITTSADGIIYIWKMHETLSKALQKIKYEQVQRDQEAKTEETELSDKEENEPQSLHMEETKMEPIKSKQEQHGELNSILQQINKAAGMIDNIKIKTKSPEDEDQ